MTPRQKLHEQKAMTAKIFEVVLHNLRFGKSPATALDTD